MPTYRKLHMKALESQDIADMPDDFTRLTWVLLPLILTRDGTTIYQPHYLRSRLYPLRSDVTEEQIAAAFRWYEERGMIRAYTVNGRRYLVVPTFSLYQGDTSRESESTLPPPPPATSPDPPRVHESIAPTTHEQPVSNSRVTPEPLTSNSRVTHESLTSNSCSYTDANADANANANANANTHARAARPRRIIDHDILTPAERKRYKLDERERYSDAVECLISASGKAGQFYIPNQAQRAQIDDAVGPNNQDSWARVVSYWIIEHGWSPRNVPRMLKMLHEGIPRDDGHRPGRLRSRRTSSWTDEELVAAREAEKGLPWQPPP